MMDEYGTLDGYAPAGVAGKPIGLEGSYGRESATGRGCVFMFREAAPALGLSPSETRCVVQGFGNVGSWAGGIIEQLGWKIVSVSDAFGAIRSGTGIDANALFDHIQTGGKLPDYAGEGVEPITPDEPLRGACET